MGNSHNPVFQGRMSKQICPVTSFSGFGTYLAGNHGDSNHFRVAFIQKAPTFAFCKFLKRRIREQNAGGVHVLNNHLPSCYSAADEHGTPKPPLLESYSPVGGVESWAPCDCSIFREGSWCGRVLLLSSRSFFLAREKECPLGILNTSPIFRIVDSSDSSFLRSFCCLGEQLNLWKPFCSPPRSGHFCLAS